MRCNDCKSVAVWYVEPPDRDAFIADWFWEAPGRKGVGEDLCYCHDCKMMLVALGSTAPFRRMPCADREPRTSD